MNTIEEYSFSKKKGASLEFEIFTIEDFFKKHAMLATKPHKLRFYQIIFVTEGEGTHSIDFQRIPYKAGSLIPTAKHQVQMFTVNPGAKGYMLLFTPRFLVPHKEDYQFYLEFIIFNSMIPPVAVNNQKKDIQEFSEIIKRINREYCTATEFGKEEILRTELKLLLLKAERIKRSRTIVNGDITLNLFKDFKDEIENNLSHRLSVINYSDKLAVSTKKLNSVVKHCTGKTAKFIIDERTILEMKRLLSYTELSVKEIGYQLGFDEPTNTVKYFKKHTGYSPSHFRKTLPSN